MKKNGKKLLILGTALLVMFAIWTCLIQCVDVQSAGQRLDLQPLTVGFTELPEYTWQSIQLPTG